jgi:hypothetical protein
VWVNPGPTDAPSSVPASAAPSASPPPPIQVLEDPIKFTSVPVGKLTGCTSTTGCQGDSVLGISRMLDATTHAQVGTFVFDCFAMDVESGCSPVPPRR